jgi:hypothetical protein
MYHYACVYEDKDIHSWRPDGEGIVVLIFYHILHIIVDSLARQHRSYTGRRTEENRLSEK